MLKNNMKAYSISTQKSWSQTTREIDEEMRMWGVSNWNTNYPRGAIREGFSQTEQDRTVELIYQKNGKSIKLVMGTQARAVDNLRVLFLAIEAMRLNERRGIDKVLESAYKQLSTPMEIQNPWQVLGILEGSPIVVAEAAYKEKAKRYHPDAGGSNEKMQLINQAIKEIREGKV
jgi:hypothetical protein